MYLRFLNQLVLKLNDPIGIETQPQISLSHYIQIPFVIGIRLGAVFGIKQVERGVRRPFVDSIRITHTSCHTVIGIVSFGRIVLSKGVVHAIVEYANFAAKTHAMGNGSHVDIWG